MFKISIEQYIVKFKSLDRKQKIYILLFLFFSFFLGTFATFGYQKLSKKSYDKTIYPTLSAEPATLSLTPSKSTLINGDTFTVTINISSPDQGVEAADFVVSYDPKYLKVATMSAGNFFRIYPQRKIEKDYVKISGVAALLNNTFLIPKGNGNIATITFQTLNKTPDTQISFDRKKTIVAAGGKDILGTYKNTDVSIN